MKKILALFISIVMVFALISCASSNGTNGEPETSAETSPSAAASSPDSAPAEPTEESTVGYFTDQVDYYARDPYEFVFMYSQTTALSEMFTKAMQGYEDLMNFELTPATPENDGDKYINMIEVFASQGKDGFILDATDDIRLRVQEVCEELGTQWIYAFTPLTDSDGKNMHPCVQLDGWDCGALITNWLLENYKTYIGDIDLSKLGVLPITFSAIYDLQIRTDAALATLAEKMPELVDRTYVADCVVGDFNMTTAYNEVAATIAAHPEIEYWLIPSAVEDFAAGAARFIEETDRSDKAVIVCTGNTLLFSQWDLGYEGPWVACVAVLESLYVGPMLCGLVAMCDGRATAETLWQEKRAPGEDYTLNKIDLTVCTKDTYKQYMADAEASIESLTNFKASEEMAQ